MNIFTRANEITREMVLVGFVKREQQNLFHQRVVGYLKANPNFTDEGLTRVLAHDTMFDVWAA